MSEKSEAIKNRLIQGNLKYVEKYGQELEKHVSGQSPDVAILTCSDSRVPLEHLFDVGIGEIFAIEVAGNVAFDPSVLGSLDYAVAHLHVPLLVILGHSHCGAVNASEAGPGDDSSIGQIVEEIRCAFGTDDNIKQNVLRQIDQLKERSQIIANALNNKELEVKGAIYHLETGKVEWIGLTPS